MREGNAPNLRNSLGQTGQTDDGATTSTRRIFPSRNSRPAIMTVVIVFPVPMSANIAHAPPSALGCMYSTPFFHAFPCNRRVEP